VRLSQKITLSNLKGFVISLIILSVNKKKGKTNKSSTKQDQQLAKEEKSNKYVIYIRQLLERIKKRKH